MTLATVPQVGGHGTAQSAETEGGILPNHPRTPWWGPENKNLTSMPQASGQGSRGRAGDSGCCTSRRDHALSEPLVRASEAAMSSKRTGETSSLTHPSNGQGDLTWTPRSPCNSRIVKTNLKVVSVLRPLDLVPNHGARTCQRGREGLTAGWIVLPSLPQMIIHKKETKHRKG